MGAITAPSRTAAASGSPNTEAPSTAISTTVSGMVMASSRQVVIQLRQPTRRDIFNPAPVSETITTSSVSRSATSSSAPGLGPSSPSGNAKSTMPAATAIIGIDRGRRSSRLGRTAVANTATPSTARMTKYPMTSEPVHVRTNPVASGVGRCAEVEVACCHAAPVPELHQLHTQQTSMRFGEDLLKSRRSVPMPGVTSGSRRSVRRDPSLRRWAGSAHERFDIRSSISSSPGRCCSVTIDATSSSSPDAA